MTDAVQLGMMLMSCSRRAPFKYSVITTGLKSRAIKCHMASAVIATGNQREFFKSTFRLGRVLSQARVSLSFSDKTGNGVCLWWKRGNKVLWGP